QQVYPPCDPNAPDVGTLNRAYEANLLALRAQGMPDLSGVSGCFKFFIVKSHSRNNLAISKKRGDWIASKKAFAMIGRALRETSETAAQSGGTASVFLIFSCINSQAFQGVARVRAPPRQWEGTADTGLSLSYVPGTDLAAAAVVEKELCVVPIEWLRTYELPFARTRNLKNPLAKSVPVAMSTDWAELPAGLGKAMMMLAFQASVTKISVNLAEDEEEQFTVIDSDDTATKALLASENFGPEVDAVFKGIAVPTVQTDSAVFEGSGVSLKLNTPTIPTVAQVGNPAADFIAEAPHVDAVSSPGSGLPRLIPASPLIVGTPATGPGPATPEIAMLLEGVIPQNPSFSGGLPNFAANLLLQNKRLFLCALNSFSAPIIGRGVLAASDDADLHGYAARDLGLI
ncbi:YTH domain-containing protein, partial [bacterium]|nr:YTH domain-containing protein [bacterium]